MWHDREVTSDYKMFHYYCENTQVKRMEKQLNQRRIYAFFKAQSDY